MLFFKKSKPTPVPDSRLVVSPCDETTRAIDGLLAAINPHDRHLVDAVLDLRAAFRAGNDANTCVAQLFQVREWLDGRHHLAFFRVRDAARRALRVEVRTEPGAPWIPRELPLNAVRIDEALNSALACLAANDMIPPTADGRFVFATATVAQ
ncbi:hypothetical protein [Opitutus sp. ER46]|uniref:hypothetical protein n=1 Tax=Opitutus sp. ER46 TaxID=2161864 RepID=UPI000D307CF9|nr:hypothetical protein [Opitutus sp. ER46]PTX96464.1 hypothetical protein DB354_07320 [Opitutus sp. ER46]